MAEKPAAVVARKKRESELLEEETKKMESKLAALREAVADERKKRETAPRQNDTTRWRSGSEKKQLRGYASAVLERRPSAGTKRPSETPSLQPLPNPTPSQIPPSQGGWLTTQDLQTASASHSAPAEAHLKTALAQQQAGIQAVSNFLESVGLPQYLELFLDNGFDDMETVLEINEEHLTAMSVPMGHKLKLVKHVKSMRKQPEDLPPLAPRPPADVRQEVRQEVESSDNMIEGQFDEAESHRSFLEALEAWRNPTKAAAAVEENNTAAAASSQPVAAAPIVEKSAKSSSLLWTAGGGDWTNLTPLNDSAAKSVESEGHQIGSGSVTVVERSSCWQCYKLFPDSQAVTLPFASGKLFCAASCSDAFISNTKTMCSGADCSKRFVMKDGVPQGSQWFCSDGCAQSAQS
eukprot:GILJ01004287.1.p1 GENE.GILJ01004287.1~~GILJ01004287.1.p1  ORF type:complete len:430 (+),score=62.36 GILJ01004287.1:70-1290(+)